MQEEQLVSKLSHFGLSRKEAITYISLLSFGTATAREISRSSGLNRSTVYVLLEMLVNKGLASTSQEEKKRFYTCSPPDRLIQTLEDEAKRATENLGDARIILPDLKSIYVGVGPKPKVTFYEGEKGIESVYEDTLTSTETIRAYASIENMHSALPNYFPHYYARRAAKGIMIRSIHPDTPEAWERTKHNEEESRDSALVPKEDFDFSPEINIYDNKIVLMSLREKFGLIIESEEIATAMKKIFELSWIEAKRLDAITREQKREHNE